jgi:hypothetical protein
MKQESSLLLSCILALALLAFALAATNTAVAGLSQSGELLASVTSEITPVKLPRRQPAPITLRIGFTSEAKNSPETPELTQIVLEFSHQAIFRTGGLPSCSASKLLYSAAPARACLGSLVGHGRVISEVTLPGRAPATVNGSMSAFYDDVEGRPGILARVTSNGSLPLTYVIPFRFRTMRRAVFGTSLFVNKSQMRHLQGECAIGHPNCFGPTYGFEGIYGHISSFELSLHRLFTHNGKRESFISTTCDPAPYGQGFPSAQVSLGYASGAHLRGQTYWQCKVAG